MRTLLVAVLLLFSFHAQAQTRVPCGPRSVVLEGLEKNFGERVRYRGLTEGGTKMAEFTVNSETGTWTLLVSSVNNSKMVCQYGNGEGWQEIPPPKKGDGS